MLQFGSARRSSARSGAEPRQGIPVRSRTPSSCRDVGVSDRPVAADSPRSVHDLLGRREPERSICSPTTASPTRAESPIRTASPWLTVGRYVTAFCTPGTAHRGDAPRRYACTFGDTPGLRRVRPEPSIWPRREYWRPTRRCLRLASRGTGGPVRDVLDRHRFLRFGQALGLSLGGRYAAAAPFGTRAKGRPVTCSNCCEAARRRSSAPSATFAAPGRAETAGRRCPAS